MSVSKSRSGVHAQLSVRPSCPLAAFSADWCVVRFLPGTKGESPPQLLVDASPTELCDHSLVEPLGTADGATVRRVDPEELSECQHDPCLAWGFSFLPVRPYNVRWLEGTVRLSFVALDDEECQALIDALSAAGIEPDVDQLASDAIDASADVETAVVELAGLTDRQRTVARRAAEAGYFKADGPAAEDVAADLGITKSTLSEHLRAVQAELLDQVFDP